MHSDRRPECATTTTRRPNEDLSVQQLLTRRPNEDLSVQQLPQDVNEDLSVQRLPTIKSYN